MTFPTPFLRRPFRIPGLIALIGLLLLTVSPFLTIAAPLLSAQDADTEGSVVIIPIRGDIEPGMGQFLDRAMTDAEDSGAVTIVLDINTPGGRLDTVLEMRDRIMDSDVPVVAWVNREAFSAGALITIASDQIWMAPAAVFGAATPIDGATGQTSSEKTISAVRSVFRATAEEHGRDPLIAEAMVDPAVEIEGLDSGSSLLTLSVEQAQEYGYAEGVAADQSALLEGIGLADAPVTEMSMTFWERLVGWVTNTTVGSLLVLVGIGLIVADGFIAGFGVAALVGVAALALFFWGYLLTGLAGWEDVLLIGIGLLLIGLEVFVIPGFGIAGLGGLLALIAGLVLSMTMRDIGDEGFAAEAGDVLVTVVASLSAIIVLLIAFIYLLPRVVPSYASAPRGLQRLSLGATVDEGGAEPYRPGWIVRLTGGAEAVERDERGHTAIHIPHDRNYTSAENERG